MKKSGNEWIGEIPDTWNVIKGKYCFIQRDGGSWGGEPKGNDSDYICIRIADFDYDKLKIQDKEIEDFTKRNYKKEIIEKLSLKKNHILIEKSGGGEKTPVGRTILIKEDMNAVYANFMDRLIVNEKIINPNYIQFCLVSFYLNKFVMNYIKQTTGIQNLDITTMLNNEKIPLPTLSEQEKIVDFLNKKLSKIDNIIEKTKETIEDYKKYKQSVITEVVTRGLNKNVEMKDSNIKWMGCIPKDWKVLKIKNILEWKSEKNHGNEQVLSLYRDYGVIPKNSRDDNHNVTSEDTDSYKFVEEGDFVINKMKAWQGSMAVSEYTGIVSPAYHVCRFTNKNINKKYFHYLLRNQLYLPEFRRLSTGLRIGQWDLGFEDFKNLMYILPPNKEQEEIVKFLDKKCMDIDKLILSKQKIIEELENYKKSLIYEYVTGKKEVI